MNKDIKIMLLSVLTEKNAIITEEMGICSIGAYLENEKYNVKLINTTRNYLDYNVIYEYEPDIIGVPLYSTTEVAVIDVCKIIKEKLPDVKFCFGGYWSTLMAKPLMEKYDLIDFIIRGEGEIAFRNLVKALDENDQYEDIKSLAYRKNGEIILNEREELINDLNSLPMANRELLRNNMLKYAYISTSRGCLANCSFCWHRSFWKTGHKNMWRGRSPENIVNEIKDIVDQYKIDRFWFIDNSFEDYEKHNQDRMWNICQEIINRDLNISYETYFRAEVYKRIDERRMRLLKESGFVGTIVGIESGNEDDLNLYRKPAKVEDNYNIVKYFRDNDIAIDIGFINFNPYSTFENLHKNIDYLEETMFGSVLYYFVERCGITKFSDIYYKVKSDGLLVDNIADEMGCFKYKYVNSDIEKLSDYLYYKYHANEKSMEYFHSKKIGNYIREEFKILKYLKRKYPQVADIITESEEKAWKILEKVNKSNSQCFRALLWMTEKEWNYEKAEEITEKYLNLNYLKEMSASLEKNRLGLYMKIRDKGIQPSSYLNI